MNEVIHADCLEYMTEKMADESIDMIITSPPYNVGKDYGEHDDGMAPVVYDAWMVSLSFQFSRILKDGGRLAMNVAGCNRDPYIPLQSLWTQKLSAFGLNMRGEIIWQKGDINISSTAWGSWQSPSNPILRDTHEYILVFSKGNMKLQHDGEATIEGSEFLKWTHSTWNIKPASAKRIGHPAPFPLELPTRLMQLYTYKGDTILDPFCGSGSTLVAARQQERNYIGIDSNKEYIKISNSRLSQVLL